MQAHLMRAAEVKKAIEWIMSNIDGHYAADSVAAAIALGTAAAETSQDSEGQGGLFLSYSLQRSSKVPSFQPKGNDATSPSNMSRNFSFRLSGVCGSPLFSVSMPKEMPFMSKFQRVSKDQKSCLSHLPDLVNPKDYAAVVEKLLGLYLAHLMRAAEVKKAIEWIMSNIDGHYAADSVAAAIALGTAAAETSQDSEGQGGLFLSYSLQRSSKVPSFQPKGNDATSPSNMSRNFRADVLRENTEAVFAACDAAHGRWAKLLGVRALLHPKLRLQEFLSIYNVTQEFITTTEKIGGRLGYSIRGTLQSQAKAFVEFQHESRMAKIKAVLDQETWVEVDVPDEFQAIVTSLFCSEALMSENHHDAENHVQTNFVEEITNNDNSVVADTGPLKVQQQIEETNLSGTSIERMAQVKSAPLAEASEKSKAGATTYSSQSNNSKTKEHGKPPSHTLTYKGVGYHMVSGLKSITSKHLALASQVISFTYAIIPGSIELHGKHEPRIYSEKRDIRRILFLKVPEVRKALLLSEIDRVAQDFKVHRDEIHTKLVQIMRERLLVHLRGLPQIVESWNRPEDADPQPSQFARSLTKEVGFLQRVLSRTLHEVDVQVIFRLHLDVTHLLGCIRSLPSGDLSNSGTPNWGQLDEFLVQRFGPEAGE
ncbi:Vacuolar protein sorting-associated protein 54, chloroplastic [Morella rubra]|uniref:Vacuolar protein sorting-associated protein 54, chloroplastic n=1 Tax=Morella rubra TaxID=262757 RepID=A0A6A1WH30_9ROSI|nr:Vacuolar protein sorting-associated protein 54, chloroplastic [Morella rubra]